MSSCPSRLCTWLRRQLSAQNPQQHSTGTRPQTEITRSSSEKLKRGCLAKTPRDTGVRARDVPAFQTVEAVRRDGLTPFSLCAHSCLSLPSPSLRVQVLLLWPQAAAAQLQIPPGRQNVPQTENSSNPRPTHVVLEENLWVRIRVGDEGQSCFHSQPQPCPGRLLETAGSF